MIATSVVSTDRVRRLSRFGARAGGCHAVGLFNASVSATYVQVKTVITTSSQEKLDSIVALANAYIVNTSTITNAAGQQLHKCSVPWLEGTNRHVIPAPSPPPQPPPLEVPGGLNLADFVNVSNAACAKSNGAQTSEQLPLDSLSPSPLFPSAPRALSPLTTVSTIPCAQQRLWVHCLRNQLRPFRGRLQLQQAQQLQPQPVQRQQAVPLAEVGRAAR